MAAAQRFEARSPTYHHILFSICLLVLAQRVAADDALSRAFAAGLGGSGQLGNPAAFSPDVNFQHETILTFEKVTNASCGGRHTVFLTNKGRALSVGDNSTRALGRGPVRTFEQRHAPWNVEVPLESGQPYGEGLIFALAGAGHSGMHALPDAGTAELDAEQSSSPIIREYLWRELIFETPMATFCLRNFPTRLHIYISWTSAYLQTRPSSPPTWHTI